MIAATMPLLMVHRKAEDRSVRQRTRLGSADAFAGMDASLDSRMELGIDDVSADPGAET
jgi:hypothetical protein